MCSLHSPGTISRTASQLDPHAQRQRHNNRAVSAVRAEQLSDRAYELRSLARASVRSDARLTFDSPRHSNSTNGSSHLVNVVVHESHTASRDRMHVTFAFPSTSAPADRVDTDRTDVISEL